MKYELMKIQQLINVYNSDSQTVRRTFLGRHKHLLREAQGKYLYCILYYYIFIFRLTVICFY
jgi:hypothetical protein